MKGWQDTDEAGQPTGHLLDNERTQQHRATIDEAGQLHLVRWLRGAGGRWAIQHCFTVPMAATINLTGMLANVVATAIGGGDGSERPS